MTDIALPSDNNRVGQATAVEQSRAAAEVHAAILVAQQCPRDMAAAIRNMEQSCAQMELAERAFFRFPRAGQTVTGASVYLAKELARCWGNVQYGVSELRRDDANAQSEMQAYAWDVETNARTSTVFIVPHKRDKKGGPEVLTDMRDIYENNANAGSRRVRECIFGVLPPWYVEKAKNLCSKTIERGDSETPFAERVAAMVKWFEGKLGVAQDQLERKLERGTATWTEHDLANLRVIGTSLSRGEVNKEDEFPPVRVTTSEIVGDDTEPAEPSESSEWPETAAPGGDDTDLFTGDDG